MESIEHIKVRNISESRGHVTTEKLLHFPGPEEERVYLTKKEIKNVRGTGKEVLVYFHAVLLKEKV